MHDLNEPHPTRGRSPIEVLEESRSFGSAQLSTRERLARRMGRRRYPASQVVFWQGDRGETAFLIESGHVWLTDDDEEGNSRFVADMGPGSLLGDHTALTGRRRLMTATARTDVVAWEMDAEDLRTAMSTDASLCFDALMTLVEMVLSKDAERVLWERLTTKQKVANILLRELDRPEGADGVVRLSQDDIGRMVGATRESVTRSLTSLRARKIIQTGPRNIKVRDRDSLEKLAAR